MSHPLPRRVLHPLALAPLLLAAGCASLEPVHRETDFAAGRVHYLELGSGKEAIVLVHGWAADTAAWRHQMPGLAELGHVLVVDLPGHGLSDVPANYSMALFADSLAAVLDDARVERAVIVGHSNGAPVALNFYRRHPHRTSALVLVDGAMRSVINTDAAESMFEPFRGAGWEDALEEMIDNMPAPFLSDDDREAIKAMALAQPHETIVGGFVATVDPGAWGNEPIDVPVLCLMTESPFWDEAYQLYVHGRVPHVDYVTWPETGHYMQMERPLEFQEALATFLRERGLP